MAKKLVILYIDATASEIPKIAETIKDELQQKLPNYHFMILNRRLETLSLNELYGCLDRLRAAAEGA